MLSKGDMRRALNVLQACHAASDHIDETAVYKCTGNPHPSDIEAVMKSMMEGRVHNGIQDGLRVETPKVLRWQI